MPPGTPPDGTHFDERTTVSERVIDFPTCDTRWMPYLHYDLSALIDQTVPPDSELLDLIECAYLEGQIDGLTADLAHLLATLENSRSGPKRYPNCYPKRNRAHLEPVSY